MASNTGRTLYKGITENPLANKTYYQPNYLDPTALDESVTRLTNPYQVNPASTLGQATVPSSHSSWTPNGQSSTPLVANPTSAPSPSVGAANTPGQKDSTKTQHKGLVNPTLVSDIGLFGALTGAFTLNPYALLAVGLVNRLYDSYTNPDGTLYHWFNPAADKSNPVNTTGADVTKAMSKEYGTNAAGQTDGANMTGADVTRSMEADAAAKAQVTTATDDQNSSKGVTNQPSPSYDYGFGNKTAEQSSPTPANMQSGSWNPSSASTNTGNPSYQASDVTTHSPSSPSSSPSSDD